MSTPKLTLKQKNLRYTLALLTVIGTLVALFVLKLSFKKTPLNAANTTHSAVATVSEHNGIQHGTWINPAKPLPTFSLKKTTPGVLTPLDFKGHWTLLFFGFSHCPEICPTALSHLTQIARQLPEAHLQNIFISVDPERDDLEQLKRYVAQFDPQLIGATGENSELNKLAQSMGTLFFKTIPDPNHPEDYFMDHGGAISLVNPEGQWAASFTPPHDINGIVNDLKQIMNHY